MRPPLLTMAAPQTPVDLAIPYRLNELEVLCGFVVGGPPQSLEALPSEGPTPREALEQFLAEELSRQPCMVNFSGGRDSSALLAVALHVARGEGLPEPVAFTLRYPGNRNVDESLWQDLVIDHLRPKRWEIHEIAPECAEFLGPIGSSSLQANGLLWPPALHLERGWLSRATGSTVITGEGGDEIFGSYRATSLRKFLASLHGPSRDTRRALRRLVRDGAPASFRAAFMRRKMAKAGHLSWLRPPLRSWAVGELARLATAEPWSWSEAVRSHAVSWELTLGLQNRDWLAASYGARFAHPFLQTPFVDAIARHGGPFGYAGRTDAMQQIFSDVLPEAVLARPTKASFNSAFHGSATRAFARDWDGTGVDPAAVDVDVLRSLWLTPRVHPGTTPLLQAAWLGSGGLSTVPG